MTQEELNTALCNAAESGDLQEVIRLHEQGADVTAWDNYAICWAARMGHLSVVQYLHENGADVNEAIQLAAEKGHLDVVQYLHENGADVTAWDNYAIRWAARMGHKHVVDYIKSVTEQKGLRQMQATQTTSTDIMGTFIENLNDIALTNDTAAKRHIFEFIVEEYLPDNFPELLPGWLEEIGNNAIHGYCAETGKWPDNDYS